MRLPLRSKLFVGVLIYLGLLGVVGAAGLYAAQASLDGMQIAVEHHVHEVSVVGELASDLNLAQTNLLLGSMADAADEERRYERQVYLIEARMDTLLEDLRRTQERFHDQGDIENIDAFRRAWDAFVTVQDQQFLPLSRRHADDDVYALARPDGALGLALGDARDKLTVLQTSLPSESTERLLLAEDEFARNRNVLIVLVVLAGVLGVAVGLSQAARLGRAIEALSQGARRVALGKLDQHVEVNTGDELQLLAESFNAMTGSLAGMTERQNEQVRQLEAENAERRRVEVALRDSEARFRSVTESVNQGIVLVDARGRVLFWNRGAETLFGYTESEIVGQRWVFLLPDRYRAEFQSGLVRSSTEGLAEPAAARTIELFGLRKDGGEIPIEISVNEWTSGDELFATATIRDVTERRAVERIKNEFVSMVSHELRTPLNGILGMTDLLARGNIGQQEREYALATQRSGEALLAIIDDILDLSKIEAGRFELEQGPVDVREVVEDVAALLAQQAQGKGLELVCMVDPELPRGLAGDARRLRQILLNLVGNAIKFTDTGEVVVRAARVSAPAADRPRVRFEIVDTGPGVSESARGGLFQPFSQADTSTTRRYGGTGLGLAISKRLAELMDGEIGFQSAPGHGSTFWFTARFDRQPASPLRPPESHALRGQRVLIVDDNASSRQMLEQLLGVERMLVRAVDSVPAARDELRSVGRSGQPYALAVVDREMLGDDGPQLAESLGDARLVLLTPLGYTDSTEELAVMRVAASVEKPVRRGRLLETLERILAASAVVAPAPARPRHLRAVPAAAAPPAPGTVAGRVLVVDDTPSSRSVAAALLQGLGFEFDLAANGREALVALERQEDGPGYVAVLMDCQMPVMDGFETTAAIRRREAGRQPVPIIAMTANAMRGDRERCLAAGMDAYLAKPLRFESLAEVLRPYLREAPPAPPRPAPIAATAGSAIDWQALTELASQLDRFASLSGDGDGLTDMIAQFRVEASTRLEALQRAARTRDAQGLREAAHGLRGSASTLGAREVQDLCLRLEQLGRSASTRGAAPLVQALQTAVDEASRALEEARRARVPG